MAPVPLGRDLLDLIWASPYDDGFVGATGVSGRKSFGYIGVEGARRGTNLVRRTPDTHCVGTDRKINRPIGKVLSTYRRISVKTLRLVLAACLVLALAAACGGKKEEEA